MNALAKSELNANKLIVGDCLEVLPTVPNGVADAAIADPPFNIGLPYKDYDDKKTQDEYLTMLREFASQVRRILKPTGCVWVFMGQEYQADTFRILRKAGFHFRNSVVWHYTFGPSQKTKFTPSWTMIHYFTCHPERFTFNADEIRVPSARQLRYKDKRANSKGKVPDDTWVLLPKESPEFFQPEQDAWLESRVCGTFKERAGHTTQLPLALVERIVRVVTNPGDLVIDPFAGSGTVLKAAQNLERRYLGIEISPRTAKIARRRLKQS